MFFGKRAAPFAAKRHASCILPRAGASPILSFPLLRVALSKSEFPSNSAAAPDTPDARGILPLSKRLRPCFYPLEVLRFTSRSQISALLHRLVCGASLQRPGLHHQACRDYSAKPPAALQREPAAQRMPEAMDPTWTEAEKSVMRALIKKIEARARREVVRRCRSFQVNTPEDVWRLEQEIRKWRKDLRYFNLNYSALEQAVSLWLDEGLLDPGELSKLGEDRVARILRKRKAQRR